ncbi:AraC family transcriptional regulator [Pseudomonas sp. LD120]|uniref:AraC family transcriptional regulator n=1 Tax=Pseudomonas sp. LD120 TaxID=485751 RepID=UPI00135734EF|nr:AraC family transcriptional regulator [Pseudomonas sp. LD120]KAF0863540.1 helix-turn-helix domain-containing protein [Pseudomonas sp. LD120]
MGSILTLRHYSHDLIAHSHEHAQLVFGLSGLLDFEIEGRGSQVQQQSFVVVPAGTRHICGSPKGSHCLVLNVPDEHWLQDALGPHAAASRQLLDSPQRRILEPIQSRLVNWLAESPVDDPLIARQGAALLLASLNHSPCRPTDQRRLPYVALHAYIDRHVAHPLQVADLARIAGISSARLHARFVAECGRTPMDYVRYRRLEMAVQLLRGSSLPIGEIASRVGYSSQSAFAAAILREFGLSPRRLRQAANANLSTKNARIATDDCAAPLIN